MEVLQTWQQCLCKLMIYELCSGNTIHVILRRTVCRIFYYICCVKIVMLDEYQIQKFNSIVGMWRSNYGILGILTLHYMSLVRRFYPKRLTYSILWTIPTGAIWGEVSCPGTQRHADCSGVWTCDHLIRKPTHKPLHHTPSSISSSG